MNRNTLALLLCVAAAGWACSSSPGGGAETDEGQTHTGSSGATSGTGGEAGEGEGGTQSGNDETGDATSDPTGGPPACGGVGLSDAESTWSLPQIQGGPGFRNLGGVDDCDGGVDDCDGVVDRVREHRKRLLRKRLIGCPRHIAGMMV